MTKNLGNVFLLYVSISLHIVDLHNWSPFTQVCRGRFAMLAQNFGILANPTNFSPTCGLREVKDRAFFGHSNCSNEQL